MSEAAGEVDGLTQVAEVPRVDRVGADRLELARQSAHGGDAELRSARTAPLSGRVDRHRTRVGRRGHGEVPKNARAVVVTLERHQRPGRVDRDARQPGGQEVTRQQADRRPHLEQRVGCPVVAGPGLDGAAGSQLEHQRAARDLDLVTGVDDVAVVERLGGAVGPHDRGDPFQVYAHRRSGAGPHRRAGTRRSPPARRPGRSSARRRRWEQSGSRRCLLQCRPPTGSTIVTAVPAPRTRPPATRRAPAMRPTSARPRPSPKTHGWPTRRPWVKSPSTSSSRSAGMPIPRSTTARHTTSPPSVRAAGALSRMGPPSNVTALSTGSSSAWSMAVRSTQTAGRAPSSRRATTWRRARLRRSTAPPRRRADRRPRPPPCAARGRGPTSTQSRPAGRRPAQPGGGPLDLLGEPPDVLRRDIAAAQELAVALIGDSGVRSSRMLARNSPFNRSTSRSRRTSRRTYGAGRRSAAR